MVAADGDRLLGCLVEWCLPVAASPLRRPAGIHGDDPQPVVGGHADQQVSEPTGGDPRDRPAEPFAAPATAEGLPAGLAIVDEVQVLHDQRLAAAGGGEAKEGADGRT